MKRDFTKKVFSAGDTLRGCYEECNFFLANLDDTSIIGTFRDCSFAFTYLRRATFLGATFERCDFGGAWANNAKFHDCTFTDCNFGSLNLTGAKGLNTCHIKGCTDTDKVIGANIYRNLRTGAQITFPLVERPRGEEKPLTKSKDNLAPRDNWVDPKPLPPAEHYRSSPIKVTFYLKGQAEKYGYLDDDKGGAYCAYGVWGEEEPTTYRKHLWGYSTFAVLECSDIEVFRGCRGAK